MIFRRNKIIFASMQRCMFYLTMAKLYSKKTFFYVYLKDMGVWQQISLLSNLISRWIPLRDIVYVHMCVHV